MTRVTLRLVAVLIAAAAFADPVLSLSRVQRRPLSIVVLDGPSLALPDARGTRREQAWKSAEALRASVGDDYEVRVSAVAHRSSNAACPATGGCVVISDGAIEGPLTSGAEVLGAVRVGTELSPNVALTRVDNPTAAHVSAIGALDVHLRATGIEGVSHIEVRDEDAIVGTATHQWSQGATGTSTDATVRVEWLPLAAGARRLHVSVRGLPGERTLLDNEADVGAVVQSNAVDLVFYEPEATWLGTFVRRALEEDGRFSVRARTRLGPAVGVSRGAIDRLTAEALASTGAVLVGAPRQLSPPDVELLERFVRVRGGSLVLLLDSRDTGSVSRLMPPVVDEHRETKPVEVGTLRATELASFDASASGVTVLESATGRAVIVSRAIGRGRVIVSGALDAWRYRNEAGFRTFWSSLVADAAAAAGDRLSVALSEPVLASGAETTVTVRVRQLDGLSGQVSAEAWLACPERAPVPVRLWPTGRLDTFVGRLRANEKGVCAVRASVTLNERVTAETTLLVTDEFVGPLATLVSRLEGAVAAHGGLTVDAGKEAAIVARVRERMPIERQPTDTRPMRSPWWLVPFVVCLSVEWWLRRRSGLR